MKIFMTIILMLFFSINAKFLNAGIFNSKPTNSYEFEQRQARQYSLPVDTYRDFSRRQAEREQDLTSVGVRNQRPIATTQRTLPVPAKPQMRLVKYPTTVGFKASFVSRTGARWTSNRATAKVVAEINLSTVDSEGLPGVVSSFTIEKLYGQKEKEKSGSRKIVDPEYVLPTITEDTNVEIRERILWNYRTFVLGYNADVLAKDRSFDNKPHLSELCEACNSGKYCARR